jgi:predicted kinase
MAGSNMFGGVASLVLLNGSPASGKSTIAEAIVRSRLLALNLDIDHISALIGNWRNQLDESGLAARALALSMANTHLSAGYDVIVPQFLARQQFIDQLEHTAAKTNARFVEIALMVNRGDAIAAFEHRSANPASQQHRDAAEIWS